MINPKSQSPNPKSQNEKHQPVLSRAISNNRADDQSELIGLLDESVFGRFKKACCAENTQSKPRFLDFPQADPFFRAEVFVARAVVSFFRV